MNTRTLPAYMCMLALLWIAILPSSATTKKATPPVKSIATAVQDILAVPDGKIDYLSAKMQLDALIDPKLDFRAARKELDQLERALRSLLPPNATDRDKLSALRKVIYESGPWNGNRPFQYDHGPLGTKIPNKLLPNYLKTRQGNCVSMPILFIGLGQRIGLNLTASLAPYHVFVRYTDVKGRVWNIETTSGANPARDAWYREQMPMSDDAVKNGVYLATLSERQTLAVMATTVLEHLMHQRRHTEAIAAAEPLLKAHPKLVQALLIRGSAYAGLIATEMQPKYPRPIDMPPNVLEVYKRYSERNEADFREAERLGWRETEGQRR